MSEQDTSLPAITRAAAIPPLLALIALNLVIWALTGAGSFWPMWPAWAFLAIMAFRAVRIWGQRSDEPGLRVHLAYAAVGAVALTALWGMSGGGYFWPVWPMLGFVIALSVAAMIGRSRTAELEVRVDELTRTRAGAVDVQASELRRIERDLHDGAQARLVALSMQLGRAEDRLAGKGADDSDLALVRQARAGSDGGDHRAARSRPRDLAAGAGRPRPGGGGPVACGPDRLRRSRSMPRSTTGRRRRSRTPPTSSSPRR